MREFREFRDKNHIFASYHNEPRYMEQKQPIIVLASTRNVPTETPKRVDWRDALSAFIVNQDVKESSRQLYERTLRLFFEWVEACGTDLNEVKRADILQYKEELLSQGLSSLTVGSYLTSIRKFYEWAEAEKIYPNVAKGIKTPRRVQAFKKQHLTEHKSAQLLEFFHMGNLRDFAIVNLILRTGLRCVEVIRADVSDITFMGDRRVLRIWGKGHDEKDDFVILTDKAYQPIKDYLNSRPHLRMNEPLFTSESHRNAGGRLTTRTVSGLCKKGLQAIGLDGREFTAHSLRHTTAVTILKHGGDITAAQTVLRHSNPATTQIYTESIKKEMRLEKAPEVLVDDAF